MDKDSIIARKINEQTENKIKIDDKVREQNILPTATEKDKIDFIIKAISEEFSDQITQNDLDSLNLQIISKIKEKVESLEKTDFETKRRIEKVVTNTVIGLGPITKYLDDADVSEIVVERYDNICIEKEGRIINVPEAFISESHLVNTINRIISKVNRQINLQTPLVDARLQDGSRVNATIPPVSPDGATLTIRKFNNAVLTGDNYIEKGSINKNMLMFLKACVEAKVSILVSGGTGTGKTTLLNMLSLFVPENELIVTIEDSLELKLHQKNIRRLETRSSMNENLMMVDTQALVKNALRMRPDRLIVGEIRDGSVVDMISAMSTGHDGSLSTVHANSPKNLVDTRLPILFGMNKNIVFSEDAMATQIGEAIQLIVQISRMTDGSRKIVNITQVCGTENKKVVLKDIFVYDRDLQEFKFTGYIPEQLLQRFRNKNVEFDKQLLA